MRQATHSHSLSTSSSMSSTLTNIILKGFLVAYLKYDTPCYPIFNGWCYLIAVTDGAGIGLAFLQVYHLWKIFFSDRHILRSLKSKHQQRVEERRIRKTNRRNEKMYRKQRQSQSRRNPTVPMRPDAAYMPRSYDIPMDDMEACAAEYPQPGSQHYAMNHGWSTEMGSTATAGYQREEKPRKKRKTQRRKSKKETRVKPAVYSSNHQEIPDPAFTQANTGNEHHHLSPNNPEERPRKDERAVHRVEKMGESLCAEQGVILDHSGPRSPPRTYRGYDSSLPGPDAAPSIHKAATDERIRRREHEVQVHQVRGVSPLSSSGNFNHLSSQERALLEPSPCSSFGLLTPPPTPPPPVARKPIPRKPVPRKPIPRKPVPSKPIPRSQFLLRQFRRPS